MYKTSKSFLIFILGLLSLTAFCQPVQWKGITKNMNYPPDFLSIDSSSNSLLLSSGFNKINGVNYSESTLWTGAIFDSLAPYNDKYNVWQTIKYKGEVYAQTPRRILRKTGIYTWSVVAKPDTGNAFFGMHIYQNNLVVYGAFDSINNIPASYIAKFDGTTWSAMDTKKFVAGTISSVEEFQGNLYISGNMVAQDGSCDNLGMYNGSNFVNVDNNVMAGGMNSVGQIIKYKGALYMAGNFNKASGNPANRFVKWDGVNWDTLGGGFTGSAAIADMTVFNNELYCVGSFQNVAGMYSPHMFKFDGATIYGGNVCNLDMSILWTAVQGYNDTLYIAGGFEKICNDSAHYIAKWLGDASSFTNSVSIVGVNELNKKENSVKVYPNPVSNTLHIESEQYFEAGTEIEITNTLGQTVLKLNYSNEIDVSSLSQGLYSIKIISPDKHQFHSKFLKE